MVNYEVGQTLYFANKGKCITKRATVVRVNKKTVTIDFYNASINYQNPAKINLETGFYKDNGYYSLYQITEEEFKKINAKIIVNREFQEDCRYITQLKLTLSQKKRILDIIKE